MILDFRVTGKIFRLIENLGFLQDNRPAEYLVHPCLPKTSFGENMKISVNVFGEQENILYCIVSVCN